MSQPRSDEDLMAAYASGDAGAFDELFLRWESAAYGYFRRRCGGEERARDLYQELFLRLHRARATYDPAQPFRPWFFQVARSVLIDDFRRAFHTREVPTETPPATAIDAGPERTLAEREEVRSHLGRLPDETARVVVGSVVLGRDYAEIAREIGKSRDAVKQIASRALRRLRLATVTE